MTTPQRPLAFSVESRRVRGFTLIELMITVAVVAILAAIAYPAYTNAVLKGKRAQGRAALLDLLTQQERYFTQNNSYLKFTPAASPTATDAAGTTANPAMPFKPWSGDAGSASAAYWLGAQTCNAGADVTLKSCVQVYARPNFTDPAAGNLTIMSTGVKGCSGNTSSVCWN